MTAYKQSYLNSCGAVALLCGAFELGIRTIPQNDDYSFTSLGPMPLKMDIACEIAVYQIISNNPLSTNPRLWGFGMPSQIIKCSKMLGLNGFAISRNSLTTFGLKAMFREELAKLRCLHALVEQSKKTLPKGISNTALAMHQRKLKLLIKYRNGDLHYVMVRPDGTVMDPSCGQNFPSEINFKRTMNMHGTGLSLIIQS
ncbi:hypothetical protein [Endozoicomonas euniceicola]|uniref:Peptidase C39 domain-containing protein n=1 Tax=Endozoicomonas euniceicola TaxID=1234143 RepID=A0ABY6GQD5_9GAMM|nr:hypothetical protein [Endozoicomonas euniceicola]UYM14308.1 hypothetical protein NX720_15530 [Endozoicomonas euniceicola]